MKSFSGKGIPEKSRIRVDGFPEISNGKVVPAMNSARRIFFVMFSFLLLAAFCGCQTAYYKAWETLGKEKRHLLKDQVEEARTEQEEAAQEFSSALERLKALYDVPDSELEDFYDKLSSDYESCRDRAADVKKRVAQVEEVAGDLFAEWEKENGEIQNVRLRSKDKQMLTETKQRFARLDKAMNKAAASMDPVLGNLKDYVLYLKHNLNAQAIGSLKQEAGDISAQVKTLVADMNKSIAEAEQFIKTLEQQ